MSYLHAEPLSDGNLYTILDMYSDFIRLIHAIPFYFISIHSLSLPHLLCGGTVSDHKA